MLVDVDDDFTGFAQIQEMWGTKLRRGLMLVLHQDICRKTIR